MLTLTMVAASGLALAFTALPATADEFTPQDLKLWGPSTRRQ